MTYKESIYRACTKTNFNDPEDATRLAQYLAGELIRYNEVSLEYEKKLKEVMTAKDYEEWITKVSRKAFERELDRMADGDFKEFCKENLDMIVGGES